MSFESKNTDETRNVLFDISLQLAIRFNIFLNKISQPYLSKHTRICHLTYIEYKLLLK